MTIKKIMTVLMTSVLVCSAHLSLSNAQEINKNDLIDNMIKDTVSEEARDLFYHMSITNEVMNTRTMVKTDGWPIIYIDSSDPNNWNKITSYEVYDLGKILSQSSENSKKLSELIRNKYQNNTYTFTTTSGYNIAIFYDFKAGEHVFGYTAILSPQQAVIVKYHSKEKLKYEEMLRFFSTSGTAPNLSPLLKFIDQSSINQKIQEKMREIEDAKKEKK